MATLFEVWLVGDDEENLAAVGEVALDEVVRIERLLSRHDPAAEIARINREAARASVRVGTELFAILLDCLGWYERTRGIFDIGFSTNRDGNSDLHRPLPERLILNPERCTVRFADECLSLDLGGYGKGYALDAAAHIFDQFDVCSTLMHGGTSSVLARGTQHDGRPWIIGLGDPFESDDNQTLSSDTPPFPILAEPPFVRTNRPADSAPGLPSQAPRPAREIGRVALTDRGLSTSATRHRGQVESDLVEPVRGRPLVEDHACVVIAPRALEAEVLSTSFLVMGEARTRQYLIEQSWQLPSNLAVAWVGLDPVRPTLKWLQGA